MGVINAKLASVCYNISLFNFTLSHFSLDCSGNVRKPKPADFFGVNLLRRLSWLTKRIYSATAVRGFFDH